MMPFVISCLYTVGSAHRYMYLKIVTEEDSENYRELLRRRLTYGNAPSSFLERVSSKFGNPMTGLVNKQMEVRALQPVSIGTLLGEALHM